MPTVGIGYLDGPRLARGFMGASDWVAAARDDLNRINVFPVPDGDTGTNFSHTLTAVADALRKLGDAPLGETAATAARAALLGARGNSGMMLAQFLIGMGEELAGLYRTGVEVVAQAIQRGAATLEGALSEPREGTILTVIRDASNAALSTARGSVDIVAYLHSLHDEAERALERTPDQLQVLRDAGVVDAGGKGFVRMVEGFLRVVEGAPIVAAPAAVDPESAAAAALADVASERDFQYCTEVLVEGAGIPAANDVRARLHELGGSVVVAVVGDLLKLHVHTDTPEAVFELAAGWGEVQGRKADDMRAQHRNLKHSVRRRVALVADSTNDLADSLLDRHGIAMVPMEVIFGTESFRDRIDLKPEEFYRRLETAAELPTTSQPAPAAFVAALQSARAEADEVLALVVSSQLSGTRAAAMAAVQAAGIPDVTIFDSRSVSLGLGLLVLRAAELAELGWSSGKIVPELERIRQQSGMFVTIERYENLIRSGRVSRGKAWLGGLLDIKPLLEIDQEGTVQVVGRIRGEARTIDRVLDELDRRLVPRPSALRFGVAHAAAPEAAESVRSALIERFGPIEVIVSTATAVLGTHVGAGAWAVAWQVEDGTGTAASNE